MVKPELVSLVSSDMVSGRQSYGAGPNVEDGRETVEAQTRDLSLRCRGLETSKGLCYLGLLGECSNLRRAQASLLTSVTCVFRNWPGAS